MNYNLPSINDWAEYMLWAEKNFKELEYGLLHKKYDKIEINIAAINKSMADVQKWVEEHREQQADRI